jgi:16S rRNA (guanine527-N7)-methyltransferase
MLLKLSQDFRDADSQLLFYKGEKVFDEIEDGAKDMKHQIIQTNNRHYLLMKGN